jgi:hypothetical protein
MIGMRNDYQFSVSEELGQLHEHATGAPAANDLSQFGRADGGITGQ